MYKRPATGGLSGHLARLGTNRWEQDNLHPKWVSAKHRQGLFLLEEGIAEEGVIIYVYQA